MSIDLFLSIVLAALNHSSELSAMYLKAKSENRDISDEELQSVYDKDETGHVRVLVDIAKAKAAGR